jgi:hypothetical protein
MPILRVAIGGPRPLREITRIADEQIKQRLESVSGVGQVTIIGGAAREIQVRLDPDRMRGYGISVTDVSNALRQQNLTLPAGRVSQGEKELTLRTMGKLTDPGQFREIAVADRSSDAMGNATACSPFDGKQDLTLDPLSLDSSGAPLISFKDGTVTGNELVAGPSIFSVNIPVTDGINLDLKITGATIKGTLSADGTTMNGKLGGVIDAKTADTIRGLDVSQIGLTPENSLLDATFANLLGPLLALPKANAGILKKYANCRTPDIDVDGDGLEAFCDSNPNDENKAVDVCIDGDGTVVMDTATTQCSEAVGPNGKPRFVDGISVEMNFQTSKVHSIKPPQ